MRLHDLTIKYMTCFIKALYSIFPNSHYYYIFYYLNKFKHLIELLCILNVQTRVFPHRDTIRKSVLEIPKLRKKERSSLPFSPHFEQD